MSRHTFFRNSHILLITTLLCTSALNVHSANAAEYMAKYNGPAISFEQIFTHADDNELKLNYARQQMAKGDYLSAAGVLEGMLYTQPNWDTARLLYAVVLYKLDDRQAAMSEFALLEDRPLTAQQRQLANSYQGEAAAQGEDKSGVQFSGGLEIGVRSDSNAGNALFETTFITADQSASSAFANGAVNMSVPILGAESGLNFNAGLRGQTRRHNNFSTSDYDVLSGSVGLSGDMGGIDWRADFNADNIYISGDKYLTQMGPKLSIGTKISDNTRISLTGAAYYQDFEDTSFSAQERYRSGGKYLLNAALFSRPTDTFSYGGSIGYESKIATTDSLKYTGFRLATYMRNEFESGIYLKSNASLRFLDYKAPNFFTTPAIERDDTHLNGRIGLGAPLNTIGSWLGMAGNPALERTSMEMAVNYTNLNSNIDIFEYNNIGGELKLLLNF